MKRRSGFLLHFTRAARLYNPILGINGHVRAGPEKWGLRIVLVTQRTETERQHAVLVDEEGQIRFTMIPDFCTHALAQTN